MFVFLIYDELVRLSSYQTLGGDISEYFGRTELCNMSGSQINSGEHILNLWLWYSPTYAINSLTYEKINFVSV